MAQFTQVFGLFYQLRSEVDIASAVGAASPFGFHFLHEKDVYGDTERFSH